MKWFPPDEGSWYQTYQKKAMGARCASVNLYVKVNARNISEVLRCCCFKHQECTPWPPVEWFLLYLPDVRLWIFTHLSTLHLLVLASRNKLDYHDFQFSDSRRLINESVQPNNSIFTPGLGLRLNNLSKNSKHSLCWPTFSAW